MTVYLFKILKLTKIFNCDIITPVLKAPSKATIYGRRSVLCFEGKSFSPSERRAVLMDTYNELFLILTFIVSLIALVVEITTKKK